MMASDAPLYDPNHTRILVLGSMGAGKTTLVHALCHDGVVLHRPKTTVGCNVDIKLLPAGGGEGDRFIEFWDVGGHPDAAPARRMFFEGGTSIAGVMLVCDSSNPRSMRELQAWMDDLESAGIGLDLDRLRATTPRDNDAYLRSPDEATGIPAGLVDEVLDQDLEGGCCPRGSMGCVPTLVVANKDDAGDAREGGQLQKFLPRQLRAARVVTTCARKLDESSLLAFFEEVFRHHMGEGNEREEGGDVHGAIGTREDVQWTDVVSTAAASPREVDWPLEPKLDSPPLQGIYSPGRSSAFDYRRRDGVPGRRMHPTHLSDGQAQLHITAVRNLEEFAVSENCGHRGSRDSHDNGTGGAGVVRQARNGATPRKAQAREKQS